MQKFEITILGSSSATPVGNRHPSAQLVNVAENYFLVDCGEGTQMQLRKFKIKFFRINHIFISHLHGDHYLGLMGFLQSMHLLGRKKELFIYAPPELKEIIELQNKVSQTNLNYTLHFVPSLFKSRTIIFENDQVKVEAFPLNHRIPCSGFKFTEKIEHYRIKKEKLIQHQVSTAEIHKIRKGINPLNELNEEVDFQLLSYPKPKERTYAYCSDTIYDESLIPHIEKVNLLYHEATFLEDMKDRAKTTYHSTASQAALIALKSNAEKLLLGHFSARYPDLNHHLEEASLIFKNCLLAIEGEIFSV